MFRRLLPLVAGLVLAGSTLTGCHGPVHVVPLITGVDWPTSFFVTPDGREIWYSERFTGEIHRRVLDTGADTVVFTVTDLLTTGERGLLGLAQHPDPSQPFIYAYATRDVAGVAHNHVLKITLSGGVGVSSQVIFDSTVSLGTHHNGGRIKFGPNGMLYIVVGEYTTPANSQNLANTNKAGKIHRITPDGAVPANNPIAGNTIWAYGIRNSFGFGFDPVNNQLWASDNGPECNDEVNLVVKGGNHSWGAAATCATPPAAPANTNQDGPLPRNQPAHFYLSPIGITGLAFCQNCGAGAAAEGQMIVASANNGQIRRLGLSGDRTTVVSDNVLYDHSASVFSVETRPGQNLYFSDLNSIRLLRFGG
jgi:glucose/arabinose dehydrogenase